MKDNLKVLMITPVFEGGGTEVYILNLIKYLKGKGVESIVVSGGGLRSNELDMLIDHHKVNNSLRNKNIRNFIISIIFFYKQIVIFKPNLIHSSSVFTTLIAKLAALLYFFKTRKKVPVIITLHGGPNKNIEKESAKILNIFADGIIALSHKAKELLINNGYKKEDLIDVIYNGINIEEGDNINFDLIYDPVNINIVICGRLTKQKGHKFLIEAFSDVLKIQNNIHLYILGDGELKEDLQKNVINLGIGEKVTFLGFRKNVLSIVEKMDIFVLPSLWEQFPISILEAMALGKPIIATNVNGVPEQLDNTGLVVEPGNSKELSAAIIKLINDKNLRNNLSNLAKQRFNNNFTIDKMGESTYHFYKKILTNNQGKMKNEKRK
ncbi:glycosyltransferase family 4 protein [Heyndrickxia coagulans]|uniref:Glycosyltransferase, group 1 family protein n=1 Tax=Heyndrickxia coagulans TaxID=1398 RepID=A0A133L130_HEYCO|nr:glycosyltransferase family 4 protein [Heyndrickxia coagulans]KWZ85250.1 glycosyltransferase, group 1 family protein [Heyndrickxia coagulans]